MKSNIKIILSSTALIAALLIIIWKLSSEKTPLAPSNHTISSTNKRERTDIKNHISAEDRSETATSDDDSSPSPQDIAKKDAIVEKIHEAAITYNAENLPVIKPYLLNSDPEIRQEAVNGMMILGDPAASPMLREAAKQMNTAQDLKIMLEAADYLELPPANLKEILKNRKKSNAEPPNPGDSE